MLLIVKVEALTYVALPFEGDASAPLILGRPETPSEETPSVETPSAEPRHGTGPSKFGPNIAAQIWLLLSFQLLTYFSSLANRPMTQCQPQPRLVRHYGSDDGPCRAVRLNRSLKRKLKRMQRRGLIGPATLREEDPEMDDLSPTQLVERMIRARQWSRVKVYRLGFGRRDLRRIAVMWAGLQGCAASLAKGMMCLAPLSPD